MLQKTTQNDDIQLHDKDMWTLILVEDDPDDQKMAVRVLENSPYIGTITCLSDSRNLFSLLESRRYLSDGHDQKVLIVLDIHMPGQDGLHLLEQLRANPYTSDCPIVIMTGDKRPERIYESYLRNASCFINKPLTDKNLKDIHTVLEFGKNWHSQLVN